MRSFQSDLSVWRWSSSDRPPPQQQLLPLSFSFSFCPSRSHRETQVCRFCVRLLNVQLLTHVSHMRVKQRGKAVSHCLKPFPPTPFISAFVLFAKSLFSPRFVSDSMTLSGFFGFLFSVPVICELCTGREVETQHKRGDNRHQEGVKKKKKKSSTSNM